MRRHAFVERTMMGALSFLRESVFADECASCRGFLQARDPRMKAISIGFLLLIVLFARSSVFLLGMYGVCLLLAAASAIPIGFFLKRTWFFIPLFALCIALPALFHSFSPGEPVLTFKAGGLTASITRQGVWSASLFFMRVLSSVSLVVLLALTTRHYALLQMLRTMWVPQLFVMTLGMCYRYIYLFIEVVLNMYTALKSRVGFVRSAAGGQRIVAWHIAGLWQRSYQMHRDVYDAMLSRGFSGEPMTMEESAVTAKDWLFLFSCAATFMLTLWRHLS